MYVYCIWLDDRLEEKYEDTKEVFRSDMSTKDEQSNGWKKSYKKATIGRQNTTQKN
jgi:hypothetical protein